MPSSPKIGKYLIRRPLSRSLIQITDHILKLLFSPKIPTASIEKILICNLAHFGDVVISTCLLPSLKRLFPNAKIGFLIHSSTKCVLKEHPFVDHLHHLDHWYFNSSSKWLAIGRHRQTRSEAMKEIKQMNYSAALDLSCSFPNAIPMLTAAKIPHRIGYESGGFSPLLTSSFSWDHESHYMGYSHLALLKGLTNDLKSLGATPLPYYPLEMGRRPKNLPSSYIVFHIGSSSELKDWPLESWRSLAEQMSSFGIPIVLTGKGGKETEKANYICKNLPYLYNLSNLCSWAEFVYTIQHATLLISTDSVGVHLAASQKIPTLILFAGMNSSLMWRPPYPQCKAIQYSVPCSPCFNKKGCNTMACMRNISIKTILDAAHDFLEK